MQLEWPLSGTELGLLKLQIEPGLKILSVAIAYSVFVGTMFCEFSVNCRIYMDVSEIAGHERTILPRRVSAPCHSQPTLLQGQSQIYFLVSGYRCVSMRLCSINWCSPEEVQVSSPYFFSWHPMACANDARRKIQHS